jgi:hypothetical protein
LGTAVSFTTLLDPSTYRDEEPFGFGASGTDPDTWLYVPESLAIRLMHLGLAYQLHHTSQINPAGELLLNHTQCESFAEELAFVRDVVDDKSLLDVLMRLMPLVESIARGRNGSLTVAAP